MSGRVDRTKLHVTFKGDSRLDGPVAGRRYTLTHSDRTGDLFLTIGLEYDREATAELQARLMADEVLAEWTERDGEPRLVLHCRAQGGLPVFGTARMRVRIFRSYMPMVLEALRLGDAALADGHPELDDAPVEVVYRWRSGREQREEWGVLGDWR